MRISMSSAKRVRNDIQVLRAVAVLLVVLSHFWGQTKNLVNGLFVGGSVGVDVFFVISGFLITSLLLNEFKSKGRISLKQFYARRIKRIMPAATAAILFGLFISAMIFKQSGKPVFEEGLWAGLFGLNWHHILYNSSYFESESNTIFTHFWSLAVEEQFYFVWPLLMVAALGFAKRFNLNYLTNCMLAFIILGSIIIHIYLTLSNSEHAYYNTFARVWELAVGALVAVNSELLKQLGSKIGSRLSIYGFVLILIPLVAFNSESFATPLWPILPVVGAVMVIVSGLNSVNFEGSRLWNNRFLIWTGKISFSLYLWHAIILIAAVWIMRGELDWFVSLALMLLSFIVAWLSTVYLEDPIRRSSWLESEIRFGFNRVHILGAVLTALIVLTYSGLALYAKTSPVDGSKVSLTSIQKSMSESLTVESNRTYDSGVYPQPSVLGLDRANNFDDGCFRNWHHVDSSPCYYGDLNADETVIVFGDSQVSMWMDNFDRWGAENGYKIQAWTKSGCPAYDVSIYAFFADRVYTECKVWRDSVFSQIKSSDAKLAIIGGGLYFATADEYDKAVYADADLHDKHVYEGYQRTISFLRSLGKEAVIVGPTPNVHFKLEELIADKTKDWLSVAEKVGVGSFTDSMELMNKVAHENNVGLFDFTDIFCNKTVCPIIVDNMMVYLDPRHVSKTYASYTYNVFAEKLNIIVRGLNVK